MTDMPKWTHEQVERLLDDVFFDYPILTDEEIDEIMTRIEPKTLCTFCKLKEADERSEQGWCMKCHFDLTEEVLGQPSGSKEDAERLINETDFTRWTFDPPEQQTKTRYVLSDEMQALIKEYREHHQKRTEMEQAHPTPSGGEEYDYLLLRDDMDYRWCMQRLNEIEERMGWLVIKQVTGIGR
jgi:hypothetical protein